MLGDLLGLVHSTRECGLFFISLMLRTSEGLAVTLSCRLTLARITLRLVTTMTKALVDVSCPNNVSRVLTRLKVVI